MVIAGKLALVVGTAWAMMRLSYWLADTIDRKEAERRERRLVERYRRGKGRL